MLGLFAQVCAMLLSGYNVSQNACTQFAKASFQQVGLDKTESMVTNYTQKEAYTVLGKPIIYSGVIVGGGISAYDHKELKLATPINPLDINNIGIDLTPNNKSYTLNWKVLF